MFYCLSFILSICASLPFILSNPIEMYLVYYKISKGVGWQNCEEREEIQMFLKRQR